MKKDKRLKGMFVLMGGEIKKITEVKPIAIPEPQPDWKKKIKTRGKE